MANLRIYGASDDLIEVEGDIREEFNRNLLSLRCSVSLTEPYCRFRYAAGNKALWCIQPLIYGSAKYSKTEE